MAVHLARIRQTVLRLRPNPGRQNGIDTFQIDASNTESYLANILTEKYAEYLNARSYCGYSDWQPNVLKNIGGVPCKIEDFYVQGTLELPEQDNGSFKTDVISGVYFSEGDLVFDGTVGGTSGRYVLLFRLAGEPFDFIPNE